MGSPSAAAFRASARSAGIGALSVSPCEPNRPWLRSLTKHYACAGCRRMVTAFCPHQGFSYDSGGGDIAFSATRQSHRHCLRLNLVSAGSLRSVYPGPGPRPKERNHR
jgi:hypothetical protein